MTRTWLKGKFLKRFVLSLNVFNCRGNLRDHWTYTQFREAFGLLYEADTKVGMVVTEESLAAYTRFYHKTEPPGTLENRLNVDIKSMALPRDNKFFKIFNEKISQLFEAGLFYQYGKDWLNRRDLKRNEEFTEPFKILTLGELEAGFIVCIVPLVISMLVFGCEWLVVLKDLLVFLAIFRKYFAIKQDALIRRRPR